MPSEKSPIAIYLAGLKERLIMNILSKLNVDSSGRLRVSAESAVIASGTVTTVSTVTTASQLAGFDVKQGVMTSMDNEVWAVCVRNRIT
jgi:hypothetical protein